MLLKFGWFIALVSILTAGIGVAVSTQMQIKSNSIVSTKEKAKIAVAEEDWVCVKETNLEILKHEPKDTNAWFMLGLANHYLGDYKEARSNWYRSMELGSERGIVHYNLACSYARENNTAEVLKNISISKQIGFNVQAYSKSDPDLEKYRDNPEFRKIVDEGNDSLDTKSN